MLIEDVLISWLIDNLVRYYGVYIYAHLHSKGLCDMYFMIPLAFVSLCGPEHKQCS
jgi:hypothetical protein